MKFTAEQEQAITSRNENLLVSAAAGSGKTAVLVERIIRRILDDEKPIDIDRLLIMTFTKAAAEQMKEKILKAIEDKRSLDPTNRTLIRQATLVHNAKITTIHGFCLDVIKNHFQEIDLDPGFRVADEGECKLLKIDTVAGVIERAYEEGSDDFINLVECMSTGKNDRLLEEVLLKMYEFSMSDPDPDEWLKRCVDAYSGKEEDEPVWASILMERTQMLLKAAYDRACLAHKISTAADGPYMYETAAAEDIEIIESLMSCRSYEDMHERIRTVAFPRLKNAPKNGPYIDEEQKERFKAIREKYKDDITGKNGIRNDFVLPMEEQKYRILACLPAVRELARLTKLVIDGYGSVKRDRNVVDFSDLEHMCIKILRAEDGATAAEYREFFEEIYVDEYQDSNLVQEELLKHITRGNNLFMVGDVKQSIYSFRLARPQLFMEKYRDYSRSCGDSHNRKIDLSRNFRSRNTVLDTVNELFGQIMTSELGGIEYDDSARLNYGAQYPTECEDKDGSELILIEHEKGTNSTELEAKVIASRIKDLMKSHMVHDPSDDDPKRMRPIRYSDIVILLRTAKKWDDTFKKIIMAEGIPVHTMSQEGYFEAREVRVLLNYLSVLDNPLQDISLAAALKSYFGDFSDEDLAKIRVAHRGKYLYTSLAACADDPDSDLHDKAAAFLNRLDHLREKTGYTPVNELLLEIIDSGYGLYISALPGGKKRTANLDMLIKKAEDYGKTSYKGLFHFTRYIKMLRDYEIDYGEANILDENDDTVRIMTIHKSKGLEFPVCFLAGMGKGYNWMDTYKNVTLDIDLGLGIDHIDPVRRIRQKTAMKRAIYAKKKTELLAEEQRILYVAMTRAKEKMILTGMVRENEEALDRGKGVINSENHLDLLLYGLNGTGIPSLTVKTVSVTDLIDEGIKEKVKGEVRKEEIKALLEKADKGSQGQLTAIAGRFAFKYPYEAEKKAFEKISVTELKRRSMQDVSEDRELAGEGHEMYPPKEAESYVPEFIREKESGAVPATLHGTAVHRVFEIWDYSRGTDDDEIRDFLDHVKQEGLMEEALADCVTISEISGFVNSPLAARMKKADEQGLLYREQPFMFSHDGIIIQGIIDAFFLEDDKIVIVDYKTDRVDDIKDLADRYHVQLEYYALALKSMLDKEIGELIIYSTRYKDIVSIPTAVVN